MILSFFAKVNALQQFIPEPRITKVKHKVSLRQDQGCSSQNCHDDYWGTEGSFSDSKCKCLQLQWAVPKRLARFIYL